MNAPDYSKVPTVQTQNQCVAEMNQRIKEFYHDKTLRPTSDNERTNKVLGYMRRMWIKVGDFLGFRVSEKRGDVFKPQARVARSNSNRDGVLKEVV